jgi:DNA-binding NarL/FixJ family response regulator
MVIPIRLMIADDHALFREGLKSLLRRHKDFRVVAEVERASDIRRKLTETACDILLLDLQMERWTLGDIEQFSRVTRVVILTASESVENAVSALRMGARGVVQKRFAVGTLLQAIRAVGDDLVWMPPVLQAEVAAQWTAPRAKALTSREEEIVRYIAAGLRNAEVGERLAIGESTVKTHLYNVFKKLGLRDRVELAVYALRHGVIISSDPNSDSNPA